MSTETSTTAERPAEQSKGSKRGFLMRILGATTLAGAIAFGAWYYLDGRWYEGTDDAYVNGNIVQVTPQITGTVVSIGADDGDLVKQGDVLIKLDRSDADVALQHASANLANTVRRVRGLYSTVSGAQAAVAVRRVAVEKAQLDYNRRRDLAKTGAISAEELSHAQDALTAAENALTDAQQQLQTNKVLVDDTVVASHPDVKAAAAAYRAAYLDDIRTTIAAPVTGYVAKRTVQVGQRVQPGAPLMAVVPLHDVWVDANFKETQLTDMRIGQPVEITADVYGQSVKYQGKVLELGVGTGAAFSLLPAQNATGNWIKIVQRMPVRVVLTDPAQLDRHPLRIGMSMNAEVNLRNQTGPMLAQQPQVDPRYSTDVFQQELAHADINIAKIVHANMAGSVD
ncbi:efflux RND transporter periplasmic adaptor subunit [Dyella psychrodurans]|uniref:HlyD family efflux transporter periplasmic adaptor subunit n=1 Tax=Dyella psychrodurans TaxID=1927960 RepID=A0A370XEL1_9GAMM|nr:efflux RND transporter periplasmic adaptor subunit [Dyella psychrodurans]RDS86690.1 HlyD family efflux transporter periplasmic adaptor subunit [Dyella psychrodurans]